MPADFASLAALASPATDAARAWIPARFCQSAVETKQDGSPATEADRTAEQAIRRVPCAGDPGAAILGEEFGADGGAQADALEPRALRPHLPHRPARRT